MTEITQYQEPAATVEVHQSVTQSSIRQTALELQDAHTIATAICRSAFVPDHLRGKPEETAVAILYGATVGFDPITAVQQIFAISGKPALYARAMVAIVLKAGHQIWTEEERPGFVTVAGQRSGSEHVSRVTWTSELATQAGYDKNPKYRSDPRSMLYARASGDVARRIAPDALLGMAYNVEEMQLAPQSYQVAEQATTSSKDRVRAAIAPSSPADEPTPSAEPATEPAAEVEGISQAQSRKMHATFTDAHITERDDRLAYASKVIGRELTSSSKLTKREASAVIEALNFDLEPGKEDADPAGVKDPAAPVDADTVWQQVLTVAGSLGMDLWSVETDYAESHEGALAEDATGEDLAGYLETLQARAAA